MVRSTLQEHPHFEVCGEAENGAEAIELAKQIKPDVAILNVMMPVLNGFDAAREIKKHVPQSAIVILSTHADRLFVNEAKKMGIRVYVSKTKVGEALVKAVEAAVRGEDFVVLE
jgi:DNA-binding NarL/FixJ family response regulator